MRCAIRTETQATRALSDETYRRREDQIVIQCDSVPPESFRRKSQRRADCRGDDGHGIHPADLLVTLLVFVRLQVHELCGREWGRHIAYRGVDGGVTMGR
jgi:hypothetical protein